MDKKSLEILEKLKGRKIGIFCDGANLYHAFQKYKWKVDLIKFKNLIKEFSDLKFFNYYLAIPLKNDITYYKTKNFLDKINSFATIKNKELKYIPIGSHIIKKGNMDIEIVLDVVRAISDLDVIIIVSGDSDFLELKNYIVNEKGKAVLFVGYKENMAWELRLCWHLYLNKIKDEVKFKQK
jgi:uncharacterized LabA/DUF88 family protein